MLGPTGSSKSAVAMIIAEAVGAEVVSVDSMQVYRRMDIGTAKPSTAERARVRHHMIDVVDPSVGYSVAEFSSQAGRSTADAEGPLLIVGGSGLHFRSIVDPLDFAPTDAEVRAALERRGIDSLRAGLMAADPDAAAHVDLDNPRRVVRAVEILELTGATPSHRASTTRAAAVRAYEPDVPLVAVGLDPGDLLPLRIEQRFDRMLDEGFADEVTELADSLGPTASQAVGYREIRRVIAGEWSPAEGRRRSIEATSALARRQRTYFRRDPRIGWQRWHDDSEVMAASVLEVFEEAGWNS